MAEVHPLLVTVMEGTYRRLYPDPLPRSSRTQSKWTARVCSHDYRRPYELLYFLLPFPCKFTTEGVSRTKWTSKRLLTGSRLSRRNAC